MRHSIQAKSSRPGEDFGVVPMGQKRLPVHRPVGEVGCDGLVTEADRASIFQTPGEAPLTIGTDGDHRGRSACDQEVGDMLDSGHGFLIRKQDEPKNPLRSACEICGGPLPTPGDDPDWLCQYGDETEPASLDCNCPWCLKYQDYMSGRYKPNGGRPRKRCGAKKCDTEATRRRQANKRARDRGKELPWPDMDDGPGGPFTEGQVTDALEDLFELSRARRAEKLDSMTRRDPWQGQRRSRRPAGLNRWSVPSSPSSP
jgi:hypothetical protein